MKRWPAALGAGALGLFVGVGLGASSPGPADAPSTTRYVTETVRAPASTVTVVAPAPAAESAVPAPETPAVAGPSGPLTTFSDGTYEVGTGDGQIAPGKYKSTGSDMCYWSRLKNNDGALGDIIDNHLGQGQMILNVATSDGYVEINGCTFTKA